MVPLAPRTAKPSMTVRAVTMGLMTVRVAASTVGAALEMTDWFLPSGAGQP